MRCEECEATLWQAGEVAPAGVYMRVDDDTHTLIHLDEAGPLPPSFDGYIAVYRSAAHPCACPARAGQPCGGQACAMARSATSGAASSA